MPNIYRAKFENDENRDGNFPPQRKNNKKNKKDFKTLKNNTVKSLNDVEYFLNNFGHFMKTAKILKLLK